MKKSVRIAMEIFVPPLVAAVGEIVVYACFHGARLAVTNIPWFLVATFVIALVPSFIYALAMEVAFACGLDPKKKRTLAISALIGALVGFGFLAVLGDNELWTRSDGDYLSVCILGLCCGLVVAFVVRGCATHHESEKNA